MNAKTLIGAAVAAAILILVGLLAYRGSAPETQVEEKGTELFPGLIEKLNDVRTLELQTTEGLYTFDKGDPSWTLRDRGGYPVQMEKVRPTLIAVAELEKQERMTSEPDSYPRLGVQAVSSDLEAEFQPKQLTLKDASGAVLASLIVGKKREGSSDGFYCRRAADPESWLVKGDLPVLPEKADEWLDKKILEIQRNDVCAARVTHPDGEVLTIAKKDDDTDYTLLELPEGRELKYSSAANVLAGSMQYLNFEDVLQAGEFTAPDESLSIANLWTKDGMRVTAEVWQKDEKAYAAFSAAYDPDGAPKLDGYGPEPPPEEPVEGVEGDESEPEAEAPYTPRPAAEVEAEVKALNDRLTPWVFQVPEYCKNNFAKHLEDLLKPLPVEEPADEAAEGEASIDNLGGEPPPAEEGGGAEESTEGTGDGTGAEPPTETGTGEEKSGDAAGSAEKSAGEQKEGGEKKSEEQKTGDGAGGE